MEQLKVITSVTECVADPAQSAEASRVEEVLSACLHGFQAISTCLLSILPREGVDNTPGSTRSSDFNAGQPLGSPNLPGSSNPSFLLQPPFLENKFIQLVRRFLADTSIPPAPPRLLRIANLGRKFSFTFEPKRLANQKLHSSASEARCGDVKSRIHPEAEASWAPLVKAASAAASSSATASRTPFSGQSVQQDYAGKADAPFDFGGRCILCVGGRAALYPEYRRVVEASGGRLMFYRKPSKGSESHLPALLARADMVVCPVDCVNHHAFFAATRYCRQSGKPCVLLECSALPTFRKGIATLAAGVSAVA